MHKRSSSETRPSEAGVRHTRHEVHHAMKTIGLNFEGKVAVVTGGAGRIGRPLCEKFATAGTAVAVVDLDAAGDECAPLLAEMRQAIAELEAPVPVVINAYAKFAGDNSAMERAAKARGQASALRLLLAELESRPAVIGQTGLPHGRLNEGLSK